MTQTDSPYGDVFFEVFEGLPRQGPGSREATARALALCADRPESPSIVDLGCGVGRQTLDLAELSGGVIVAVDNHQPFLDTLASAAKAAGLAHRVKTRCVDMAEPGLPSHTLDIVWSEGALYQIGLAPGLELAAALLKPGGYLAFTEAVWRGSERPEAVQQAFDYPAMGRVVDALAIIEESALDLVNHFTLPDEAWWEDFYTPMEARVSALRDKYAADGSSLALLDDIQREITLHRECSHTYAYEFFVAQLPR